MIYLICFLISLSFAIGNVMQKLGLIKEHQSFWNLLKTPIWWFGISLSGAATLGYYYAMSQWNLSLVQSLLVLNPILTAILGYKFLKEPWDAKIKIALCLSISGLFFLALSPSNHSSQYSSLFWAWLGLGFLGAIGIWQASSQKEIRYSLLSGWGFGFSAIAYKGTTLLWEDQSKYVAILFYIIYYLCGFYCSQIALKYGRALFVIPCSAAVGTILPLLAGTFLFQEELTSFSSTGILLVSLSLLFFLPTPKKQAL